MRVVATPLELSTQDAVSCAAFASAVTSNPNRATGTESRVAHPRNDPNAAIASLLKTRHARGTSPFFR